MDPAAFDMLKSGPFKNYMGWGGVHTVPEQIISNQFNKLYENEIQLYRDPKENAKAKSLQMQKLDPKDKSWLKQPTRMQPVVYQISKEV